jgi:ketosteroid isomerase-like protein
MANPISERPLPALIDDLANAIRAKDVNAVMTYYAPDVLAFDLLPCAGKLRHHI